MSTVDPSDQTDEAGALSVGHPQAPTDSQFSKGIYGKAKRVLEEHELASPVAIRFMVDQIEKLEEEVSALTAYREQYHRIDADLRVEKSRSSLTSVATRVSSGMLALGSAGAGTVVSFLAYSDISIVLFILFIFVAIGSFLIRVK